MTNISKMDDREIAFAIVAIKARCGALGLLKTMHSLEPATQAVGWEIAEKIERTEGTAAKDAAYRKSRRMAVGQS